MTRSKIFWLVAIACTAATFGAQAQDIQTPAPTVAPGPSGQPSDTGDGASLERLDGNNDGRITKAEAKGDAELTRRFSELDTDNSGKLDRGEFARFEIGGETSAGDARSRGGVTAGSDSDSQPRTPIREGDTR